LHVSHIPFFINGSVQLQVLATFPTRRSSDLCGRQAPLAEEIPEAIAQMEGRGHDPQDVEAQIIRVPQYMLHVGKRGLAVGHEARSEEHTSELQSRGHLVCRLLLEKKNFIIER